MAYEWKDKIVLITGAATGIGAAAVRILMEENVKHVAVLDVNEKAGVSLQNELNKKYPNKVKFYKCDVIDDNQLQGCFDALMADQGYIDVVVNNAGILNDSLEAFKKMIDVNVTALCSATVKALEIMSKENGGRGGTVINVSSIVALFQSPCMVPIYFATKSAVLQFSNCIGGSDYYPRTGVRVLAICFGVTDTPLMQLENFKSFDKKMEATFPKEFQSLVYQKQESAAQGLVDAYKLAQESGSTWLAINDLPVEDITATVKQAYGVLSTKSY